MKKVIASLALLFVVAASQVGSGQQTVPFQGGIPVAPRGLAGKRLPDKPVEFDTGEGQRIRVSVVTKALAYPFSMTFLPDGSMLVTERLGQLRIIRNGVLDPKPVAGIPMNYGAGESGLPGAVHGLMDVVLHPRFADNRFVYLNYTKRLDEKRNTIAISRSVWNGSALTDTKDIFVATERTGTSRLAFGRDGMLYLATSGFDPQDPNTHGGKVLRLRDDGTVPPDNPFVGKPGYKPEVYTLGHRSSLGLAVHPGTGEMWQHENGPNGGDEINILKPGANYGWPTVSYGRQYTGPWQAERPGHGGFEPPIVYWMPSIAASGMTFYTGDKLSKWKGDVFVGSLRTGEIPGTGHLERILFNEKMEELRRESLLVELRQRIRDVRQGPDGLLYVLTDEKEGAVLRIEPVAMPRRDRRDMGVMYRAGVTLVLALVSWTFAARLDAQLLKQAAPIRVGHYHLNVTSVDEHRKFWVDTLGGTATKVGGVDAVRFGDVFLLLRPQRPTGPTRGTTFDHIGFAVPSVPEFTTKVVASGYKLTVGREIPGQAAPAPPAPGTSAVYGRFSYLVGPDGVKVELVTNMEPNAPPIVHHHVHFTNPQYVEMGQWYMKALDATLRPGQTDFFFGADLPGIGYMLNFFRWEMNEPLTGTAGRAVDHVGFEVRNLEEFCRKLEAQGIKLTAPYRKDPALDNIGTASLVDPWGTVVELTEGLDKAL